MANPLKYSSQFADKMTGGNPFPTGDPRHQQWEDFCRDWFEKDARFQGSLPKLTQENFHDYVVDSLAGRFDVGAEHFLRTAKGDCQFYEQFLDIAIKGWVDQASKFQDQDLVSDISLRLTQRKMHWMAKALEQIREHRGIQQATSQIAEIREVLRKSQEGLDRAAAGQAPSAQPRSGFVQDHPVSELTRNPRDEKDSVDLKGKLETGTIAEARKAIVLPILEEKGWSILDWANESDVAYHTAADYLAGTTAPYRSTRVKLAKGLGIPVNSLPK